MGGPEKKQPPKSTPPPPSSLSLSSLRVASLVDERLNLVQGGVGLDRLLERGRGQRARQHLPRLAAVPQQLGAVRLHVGGDGRESPRGLQQAGEVGGAALAGRLQLPSFVLLWFGGDGARSADVRARCVAAKLSNLKRHIINHHLPRQQLQQPLLGASPLEIVLGMRPPAICGKHARSFTGSIAPPCVKR